jgi:hypothetical protein
MSKSGFSILAGVIFLFALGIGSIAGQIMAGNQQPEGMVLIGEDDLAKLKEQSWSVSIESMEAKNRMLLNKREYNDKLREALLYNFAPFGVFANEHPTLRTVRIDKWGGHEDTSWRVEITIEIMDSDLSFVGYGSDLVQAYGNARLEMNKLEELVCAGKKGESR